ncbi:hypothetical protein HMPREF9098_0231 [Kingella denitrificans ATCC 33394]|uniref:Uncharacterized protein n=1 Tax=Kingella denitrificans ATCC 33394 TaxID=888741 RepID=F0EWJ5_9NEIS|nr:hypothetical protein HMPREF9098_0231 [Kingella denitrificans ATCC 33394]
MGVPVFCVGFILGAIRTAGGRPLSNMAFILGYFRCSCRENFNG